MKRLVVLLAVLLTAGCSYIPWHPFGTPLTAEKKAEQKVTAATSEVLKVEQEAVHKTNDALDEAVAGNPRALAVAADYGKVAEDLIDQAIGSPNPGDEAKWRDLIVRLVSDNEEVRQAAAKDRAADEKRFAAISDALTDQRMRAEKAETKALQYAAEKEQIANHFLYLAWAVGAFVALYFLGQLLKIAASFNPAFAGASAFVDKFITPPLHSVVTKARQSVAPAAGNS